MTREISIRFEVNRSLELSVSSYKSSATKTTFNAHLKLNCSQLHTTRSDISSAAGASDSNSRRRPTAPPINVFDIDIDIKRHRAVFIAIERLSYLKTRENRGKVAVLNMSI